MNKLGLCCAKLRLNWASLILDWGHLSWRSCSIFSNLWELFYAGLKSWSSCLNVVLHIFKSTGLDLYMFSSYLKSSSIEVVFPGCRLSYFQILANCFELHWVRTIQVSKIHKVVFSYLNSLKVRGCLPCWLSTLEVVFQILQIFKIVSMCTGVDLQMLQSKLFWFPAISLLVRTGRWVGGRIGGWAGGWVAGLIKIKVNSAQLNWGWGWAWQK
jgi:hypothetical protein